MSKSFISIDGTFVVTKLCRSASEGGSRFEAVSQCTLDEPVDGLAVQEWMEFELHHWKALGVPVKVGQLLEVTGTLFVKNEEGGRTTRVVKAEVIRV